MSFGFYYLRWEVSIYSYHWSLYIMYCFPLNPAKIFSVFGCNHYDSDVALCGILCIYPSWCILKCFSSNLGLFSHYFFKSSSTSFSPTPFFNIRSLITDMLEHWVLQFSFLINSVHFFIIILFCFIRLNHSILEFGLPFLYPYQISS